MLLTISLAHGLGPKSLAAMLGTTLSLVLVALLALVFTELTHLTGLASEESALLQLGDVDVSFKGLLLAGMRDRRARSARRRHREPVLDRARAARGEPGARVRRALSAARSTSAATTSRRP